MMGSLDVMVWVKALVTQKPLELTQLELSMLSFA